MHKQGSNAVATMFFMPSFYGALSWGTWLFLYSFSLMRIDQCSLQAMLIYIVVEILFVVSSIIYLPSYSAVRINTYNDVGKNYLVENIKISTKTKLSLLALHLIGLFGICKYVLDFSREFGGLYGFFFALISESHTIRWEAETARSIGTQISYFGWLAIGITIYYITKKRISNWWWPIAILQFAGNLMFIDRTRPFTIMFTSMLLVLPAVKNIDLAKIIKWTSSAILIGVITFWLVAEWTGKTYYKNSDESSNLPGITYDIYMYGAGGFAYFNYMLGNKQDISYAPDRFLYPLNKILSACGLASEPPSPITEFYAVPFETNVGTFLEPLYRDGGIIFVLVGIVIYCFGFNYICLFFLRAKTPVAYYAWATLCFITCICFFVPKISSTETWLFVGLGMASLVAKRIQLFTLGKQEVEERVGF
jgi:oligosaccharide repeat unit polymerase